MNTLSRILCAFAVCLLCGCSSFNRDWEKALQNPQRNGIAGCWEGTWSSDANNHSGNLRCLLEPISDRSYRARFDSTYKEILHFKSDVVLNGEMRNGVFSFEGEAKLPWWAGGLYQYEGGVTRRKFFSTYKNKYDHGTFQMSRPVESFQKFF